MNEIAASEEYKKLLQQLISEIKPVAEKIGISVADDTFEKTVGVMAKLPAGATTSMHRDFQKGKATELDSLTGYVIQLGKQFGIAMPTYEMMYEGLKKEG